MANDVRPGEVEILALTLTSSHGYFDMAVYAQRCSVFESIFKNGNYAEFEVLDIDDALGDLRMNGTERVHFSFRVPTRDEIATYEFAVNSIRLSESQAGRARTYTIECVSIEVQNSRMGLISKKWKSTVTAATSDIFRNFLGSAKSLQADQTRGVQELRISNKKAFTAINEFAQRANGADGNQWLFFENRDGYHFSPIEKMQQQGSVRSLTQHLQPGRDGVATFGPDDPLGLYRHILHYEILSKLNVEKTIKMGALKTNVSTWNFDTREFNTKDIVPKVASAALQGMVSVFGKAGRSVSVPVNGRMPTSHIPTSAPEAAGAAAAIMQLVVIVQTYGDTIYRAGWVIDVNIPRPVALTGPQQPDQVVSGNFLISKLRHEILHFGHEPRYTCVVEALQNY